jgi:hypothetical protein
MASFIFLASATSQITRSTAAAGDPAEPPVIIFGFVGGFVRHDNAVHSVVQLAERLRKQSPAGTIVETFENHSGEIPHQQILTLLDTNHDGNLSVAEKQNARIILYGHSWGASEIVDLSRRLQKDGVPVLLTVQVDSVAKLGENDDVIPANVAQAANFYQSDGMLRGASAIRAADAARTRILGNFRFSYAATRYNCTDFPWYARVFMKAHTQIECDSKVWNQVESLINSNLVSAMADRAPQ